jgi:hypothetical protein
MGYLLIDMEENMLHNLLVTNCLVLLSKMLIFLCKLKSALSQAERLQREILSIQEQNRKIADRLQAGSDKARGLEFEVERILLKFQGEMKTSISDHPKKAYIRRGRVPLRTFLFGKKEHGQKRQAFCACTPVTNE